jgi:hypothetical protein
VIHDPADCNRYAELPPDAVIRAGDTVHVRRMKVN